MMRIQPLQGFLLAFVWIPVVVVIAFAPPPPVLRLGSPRQWHDVGMSSSSPISSPRRIDNTSDTRCEYCSSHGGEGPRSVVSIGSSSNTVSSDTTASRKDSVAKKEDADVDVGKEIFLAHLQENLAVTKQLLFKASVSSSDDHDSSTASSSLEVQEVPNHPIIDSNRVVVDHSNGVTEAETTVRASTEAVKNDISPTASVPEKAVVETRTTTTTTTTTRQYSQTSTSTTAAAVAALAPVPPRVSTILKFAIPATGVWLCGPLLSLIDTSTVGILSGTIQQAALNPAVAVTDYAALLIAFLYTGTTNLIASARDNSPLNDGDRNVTKGRHEQNKKMVQRLIGALQLSTFVGAGLGAILFCFAKPLLTTIIGNADLSPTVFAAAMKYVKIRALGMPAAAVIGSAQAACLGMQDIKSPLYVLAVAAAVNFMGDMLFVGSSHPLIGGAAGAAWATVFSQYVAVGLFIHWLCNKPQNPQHKQQMADPSTAKTTSEKKTSTASKPIKGPSFSVRGFLQGSFRARDLLKPPSRQLVREFSPYILPVTSTQVGRVSGYVAMAHVVSSSLGTVSMAAQQVIVSLFYCLCPMADSLSLTAQSFVPTIHEKAPSKQRTQALRKTIVNFVKAGAIFGCIMTGAVACIPLLSRFFTSDQVVISMVNQVVPLLLAFFSVHGILCAAEGLLLGQKDLGFLGKMYGGYFFAMPFFMLRVKKAALTGNYKAIGLTSVWTVFVVYQAFRFSAWMIRVGFLQRRNELKASGKAATKNAASVNALSGLAPAAAAAL